MHDKCDYSMLYYGYSKLNVTIPLYTMECHAKYDHSMVYYGTPCYVHHATTIVWYTMVCHAK